MNEWFSFIVLTLIVVNTIVLALYQYPIDSYKEVRYNMINTVLTWLFFLEFVIKVVGLGPSFYLKDKVNISFL